MTKYYLKNHIRFIFAVGFNNTLFLGGKFMKKMTILLLLLSVTSQTMGAVSARVCLHDGITPLELADPCIPDVYRDVMVGTKLTVLVSANVAEEWYNGGALIIEEENMANVGNLYGRPPIDEFGNYIGSCLPDAGEYPAVYDSYPGPGFDIYAGFEPNAGDWFILDYNALDLGDCNVAFYNFDVNDTAPIQTLVLHHVPTRDFDGNTKVDFADFAILASYWLEDNCRILDNCEGADLDNDGNIDLDDLMKFCEFWLAKTE